MLTIVTTNIGSDVARARNIFKFLLKYVGVAPWVFRDALKMKGNRRVLNNMHAKLIRLGLERKVRAYRVLGILVMASESGREKFEGGNVEMKSENGGVEFTASLIKFYVVVIFTVLVLGYYIGFSR
jgi:hypothetical protein